MIIRVVHVSRVNGHAEYVGRPSVLGNPFTHKSNTKFAETKVASREEAINSYRKWLRDKVEGMDYLVMKELIRLKAIAEKKELVLSCWCAPHACHAEVIRDMLFELGEGGGI